MVEGVAGEDCIVIAHGGPLKLLAALLRGAAPDLLAPAPPLGSVTALTLAHQRAHVASRVRMAQSMLTAQAPSTSPVNPPS